MNDKQDRNSKKGRISYSFKYNKIILITVSIFICILFICDKSFGKSLSQNEKTPSESDIEETVIVTFGRYEQDGNLENGPEPIEWIVLKADGNKALLISRYILDFRPMHSIREEFEWKDTELREWLEEEFFAKAFSFAEKHKMLRIELSSKDLHNRSIVLSENSFSSMAENPFLYKLLGAKDYKAPEGIPNFVVCPNGTEVSLLKDKQADPVPAIKRKCDGYWLRNWSSRTMYELPITYYRYISEFGKEHTMRAEQYNGVRPEILIKIDD